MNNKSPFTILKNWFIGNTDDIPIDIINSYNPRSILSLFSGHRLLTPYLNRTFNNINLYYIDKLELCKFLRELSIKHKLKYNDFTFLKVNKIEN